MPLARRAEIRAAFAPEGWTVPEAPPRVWARIALLEERLDLLPARRRDDVLAHLEWMAAALTLSPELTAVCRLISTGTDIRSAAPALHRP